MSEGEVGCLLYPGVFRDVFDLGWHDGHFSCVRLAGGLVVL